MSLASTTTNQVLAAPAAALAARRRDRVGIILELTKARLSAMVLLTTLVGFLLASPAGVDWLRLMATLAGTALAAACANALNQVAEIDRDARMIRTRQRPLPCGALAARTAILLGIAMGATGLVVLATLVNLLAAGLAFF
ncbi:MAG: UbiA family prenyltransferase, partial [Planctomycetota bacterium]